MALELMLMSNIALIGGTHSPTIYLYQLQFNLLYYLLRVYKSNLSKLYTTNYITILLTIIGLEVDQNNARQKHLLVETQAYNDIKK